MKKTKTSFLKSSLFSYLLFLILLFLGAFLFGIFMNSEGSGSGEFAYYRGPVLPMTSLNGAEGIEVNRNVNFDFSPYQDTKAYSLNCMGAARITDTYILTNATGETKMLDLAYGFQGSFNDQPEEFPVITVNEGVIQPELCPSIDPEEKLFYSGNFEKYSKIFDEKDFLGIAMEQFEALDIPVTAYHFMDLAYNGTVSALDPMLTLRCTWDENTTVFTMGLSKAETEKDGRQLMMFAVRDKEAWLFTLGGTLIAPEFGGNKSWIIEKDSAIEGVTYQLETYETTLMDAILECADQNQDWGSGVMTPEILAKCTANRIQKMDTASASGLISFNTLFYDAVYESRLMYQVFQVKLRPGESVTLEAAYIQEPSWDGSGPKDYREGYDLATKLGSDLNFTALSSSLTNTDRIRLGAQNFGFDLEKGITNVSLDLQTDRYYMEIYLKK